MKHSRVAKFKEYRDSFTKADAQDIDGANDIISGLSKNSSLSSTTNTLPYDEVIKEVGAKEEQDKLVKKAKQIKIIKIVIASVIGAIVLAGLIILGIIGFGGK